MLVGHQEGVLLGGWGRLVFVPEVCARVGGDGAKEEWTKRDSLPCEPDPTQVKAREEGHKKAGAGVVKLC